jgi:hypothetical protein
LTRAAARDNAREIPCSADAGLYSPELQITNEPTTVSVANDLWNRIWTGHSTQNGNFSAPAGRPCPSPEGRGA